MAAFVMELFLQLQLFYYNMYASDGTVSSGFRTL